MRSGGGSLGRGAKKGEERNEIRLLENRLVLRSGGRRRRRPVQRVQQPRRQPRAEGLRPRRERTLAEASAKAGNVILPVWLDIGVPQGKPDKPLAEFVRKSIVPLKEDQGLPAMQIQLPIEPLGNAAAGVGNLSNRPDVDGGIRTEPLVLRYYDQSIPALSLMIAAKSLNLTPSDIKLQPESVTLGKLRIATPNLK